MIPEDRIHCERLKLQFIKNYHVFALPKSKPLMRLQTKMYIFHKNIYCMLIEYGILINTVVK